MKNTLHLLAAELSRKTGIAAPEQLTIDAIVGNIEVRSDQSARITLIIEHLPNIETICAIEVFFEKALEVSDVSLLFPSSTPVQDIREYLPWAVRHLEKRDALTGAFFRSASVDAPARNEYRVFLPEEYDRSNGKTGCQFLEEFFRSAVPGSFSFIPVYVPYNYEEMALQAMKTIQQTIDKKPVRPSAAPRAPREQKKEESAIWGKINPSSCVTPIGDLHHESGPVALFGWISSLQIRQINQKALVKFSLSDHTGTVLCTAFMKPQTAEDLSRKHRSAFVEVRAIVAYDAQYEKDLVAKITGIRQAKAPKDTRDDAPVKRVELHAHTKMSAKDAVCNVSDLIAKAVEYGHPAIAITDHGVVQSFPDARKTAQMYLSEGKNIKIIYGMECYLADDGYAAAFSSDSFTMDDGFVSFELIATGSDPSKDRLTEIAACLFVKEDVSSYRCKETLHIRFAVTPDSTQTYSKDLFEGIKRLHDFIAGRPVVAEDAISKISYLRTEGFRTEFEHSERIKFFHPLIDTRKINEYPPGNSLAAFDSDAASSFLDDAPDILRKAYFCGRFLEHAFQQLKTDSPDELNRHSGQITCRAEVMDPKNQYHCILLARDQVALYCLYRLVSLSHLRYINKDRPRIPRSLVEFYRTGLIIGSACESGEIFQRVADHYDANRLDYLKASESLIHSNAFTSALFYDYLEIQPIGNNRFYLRSNEKRGEMILARYRTDEDLENLNRLIAELAVLQSKKLCATCDVHFLRPSDKVYREILQKDLGYSDAGHQPPLYFRTTEEMLAEFGYLGQQAAYEAVVENPVHIASMVSGDIKPFPEGIFPPVIPHAAQAIEKLTRDQAIAWYGHHGVLPEIVAARIKRELDAIIGNGFAVMYYIAHLLVKQSIEDGYPVGSRGSVGSSLVATLCKITEVNPLPVHYRCPECRYSRFFTQGEYYSGYDMPQEHCPECDTPMLSDGQDIPFETFLGFEGEKQPDIDLNFSGEYQMRAHKFVEKMFGADHTFRAGTIIAYAEKNAVSIAAKHCQNLEKPVTRAEVMRLSRGIIGVKTTTSQHPGGIVVLPAERDICEFTPVQSPADKTEQGKITTHFDFHSLHDTILKFDILGHDDPTMLKMLGDLTGVSPDDIPLCDPEVMKLFASSESLGFIKPSATKCGTLGLPELGTPMARGMIEEAKPSTFYDLVQLMGLSHGKDVWKGNARELIRSSICTLRDVIGCRDSIMTTLMHYGLESKHAFEIMEKVRKGKGLTEEQENIMKRHKVPSWYIESCKKIQYMFPKAHAVAYSISALRIAWYKVYRKTEYYCAFFSVRADEFDARLMCRGHEYVRHCMEKLKPSYKSQGKTSLKIDGKEEEFSADKAKNLFFILELIDEMYCRGVEFVSVSIFESDAVKFLKVDQHRIRPPLNTLPNVSVAIAQNIVRVRKENPVFISREDFSSRCGIGDSLMNLFAAQGCLDDLPETTQVDLYSLLA